LRAGLSTPAMHGSKRERQCSDAVDLAPAEINEELEVTISVGPKPLCGGQEYQMKANFQSNVALLDIGQSSGTYGNTPNFIYSSWKKMPNYALEYVVERAADFPSTGERTSVALRFPHPAASPPKEPSAPAPISVGAISSKAADVVLTPRQRDVFDLIVQGMSNKEIARNLQLAEGTVKIHIKALFAKLGVRRRAAVAVAGTRLLSSPERGSC